MKELNLKTLDKLYETLRQANIDPDQIRDAWRKQFIRDIVLQREVDSKVYFSWSSKEIKEYYEKNKSKFVKPEMVSLSELFLSFAGRDEAEKFSGTVTNAGLRIQRGSEKSVFLKRKKC